MSSQLDTIEPQSGDQWGGTRVRVEGAGIPENPEFFFGPFPAAEVTALGDGVFELVTPEGSPGPSPIRLRINSEFTQPLGYFEYTSDTAIVWAFKPTDGADSGGTFLRFFGEGLESVDSILFRLCRQEAY